MLKGNPVKIVRRFLVTYININSGTYVTYLNQFTHLSSAADANDDVIKMAIIKPHMHIYKLSVSRHCLCGTISMKRGTMSDPF